MGEVAPAKLITRMVLRRHSVMPYLKLSFHLLHGLSFWLKFPSGYSLFPKQVLVSFREAEREKESL